FRRCPASSARLNDAAAPPLGLFSRPRRARPAQRRGCFLVRTSASILLSHGECAPDNVRRGGDCIKGENSNGGRASINVACSRFQASVGAHRGSPDRCTGSAVAASRARFFRGSLLAYDCRGVAERASRGESAIAPSSTELQESHMSEPPHADRGDPPPAPPRAPEAGECCESGC